MNIDKFKKQFSNEDRCRHFFESLIWADGRKCPHCQYGKSYLLKSASVRSGTYECARCKRQFTVTTNTPTHSTKLSLWKWLQTIYYIVNSSKSISSVTLAQWIGVTQPTAWRMDHAIRQMMIAPSQNARLTGIFELDEEYFGGKPRYQPGVTYKRCLINGKQRILIAVERQGSIRSQLVVIDSISNLSPVVRQFVHSDAHFMTDQHMSFLKMAKNYAGHSTVNHLRKEYCTGDTHTNTAESFSAMLESTKLGVFHYMSNKHLSRYLNEIGFR